MRDGKELASLFVTAFNEQDAEMLKGLFTPDVVWAVPGVTLHGRDQITQLEQAFWDAFPDGRRTIDRLVAEGSTVVEEGTFTGTHDGTFHSPGGVFPPSGNRVQFSYVVLLETRADEIASKHFYFDTSTLLAQLTPIAAEVV